MDGRGRRAVQVDLVTVMPGDACGEADGLAALGGAGWTDRV